MSTTLVKVLVAAAMLATPAAVGVAWTNDALPGLSDDELEDPSVSASAGDPVPQAIEPPEPPSFEGELVKAFEGDVPNSTATGTLDLRVDHGSVFVAGWNQSAYRIEVLQAPGAEAKPDLTFEDASTDEHLNLTLFVDQPESHTIHASPDNGSLRMGDFGPRSAVVAYVPWELAYDEIHLCEGQAVFGSEAISGAAKLLPGHDVTYHACVPAEQDPAEALAIEQTSEEDKGLDIPFGAQGLSGADLHLDADNAHVELDTLSFDTIHAVGDNGAINATQIAGAEVHLGTDNGAVELTGLEADELHAWSDNGHIEVAKLTAGEVHVATDNGHIEFVDAVADTIKAETDNGHIRLHGTLGEVVIDSDNGAVEIVGTVDSGHVSTDSGSVDLVLDPASSGALDVDTDNGEIRVQVPTGPTYGYTVDAETDNGHVQIDLEDTQIERPEDDGHPARNEATARTDGFEEREIQVTLTLTSDNGAITVTDDPLPDEPEEEEDPEPERRQATTSSTASSMIPRRGS